jgi:hypothetical protein
MLLAKDFLAFRRQVHVADACLPIPATAGLDAHGPSNDLVPKAHADGSNAAICQHFLREFDQLGNPKVGFKGVVSWRG